MRTEEPAVVARATMRGEMNSAFMSLALLRGRVGKECFAV